MEMKMEAGGREGETDSHYDHLEIPVDEKWFLRCGMPEHIYKNKTKTKTKVGELTKRVQLQ